MAKSKVKSEGSKTFAKGGSGHMHGKQHAGPQKPGTSSHDVSSDGGKFGKGGSGHMFGKQSATTKVAGTSGKP
jgi:hypothetical protein